MRRLCTGLSSCTPGPWTLCTHRSPRRPCAGRGDGSVGGHVMDELSQYLFEPLWAEGEFVLSRSVRDAALAPLLVMAPVLAQPAPESLQRLAHAYALREALEPTWAACPLALVHYQGRPTLVLADPGGEVLARLVGQPWE